MNLFSNEWLVEFVSPPRTHYTRLPISGQCVCRVCRRSCFPGTELPSTTPDLSSPGGRTGTALTFCARRMRPGNWPARRSSPRVIPGGHDARHAPRQPSLTDGDDRSGATLFDLCSGDATQPYICGRASNVGFLQSEVLVTRLLVLGPVSSNKLNPSDKIISFQRALSLASARTSLPALSLTSARSCDAIKTRCSPLDTPPPPTQIFGSL